MTVSASPAPTPASPRHVMPAYHALSQARGRGYARRWPQTVRPLHPHRPGKRCFSRLSTGFPGSLMASASGGFAHSRNSQPVRRERHLPFIAHYYRSGTSPKREMRVESQRTRLRINGTTSGGSLAGGRVPGRTASSPLRPRPQTSVCFVMVKIWYPPSIRRALSSVLPRWRNIVH